MSLLDGAIAKVASLKQQGEGRLAQTALLWHAERLTSLKALLVEVI